MTLQRTIAAVGLMLAGSALAASGADSPEVGFAVVAGSYSRMATPIRFEVPASRFGEDVRKAVASGPVALKVLLVGPTQGTGPLSDPARQARTIAQAERVEGSANLRVTCVVLDEIPAGSRRAFALAGLVEASGPAWSLAETTPGAWDLKRGDRPVFRYNASPVSSPNYGPIQVRDAYIHPAYSPAGALITGDFSPSHPHHRGFFLAYERTKTGDQTPDFWNIHHGSGKIYAEEVENPTVGPVTARFSARHRWEAKDPKKGTSTVALRERWDVEAYALPGAAYWLFDLTSSQQAVGQPMDVLPYRYGGMAYRGPEPFVKGTLDVLNSEGQHRKDGDQKPARWVDLTGPVAEGSSHYAGAMIADHPSNPHYPNVARIHPTTLPFFTYVPAYDKPLTLAVEAPTVFRYRVLIHDGRPDGALDERVARDFAEPPTVILE
jgi:hypothetical protein